MMISLDDGQEICIPRVNQQIRISCLDGWSRWEIVELSSFRPISTCEPLWHVLQDVLFGFYKDQPHVSDDGWRRQDLIELILRK